VKWNFKDLSKGFAAQPDASAFEGLHKQSKEWRRAMIETALSVDIRIVVSCVKHHSIKKSIIEDTRVAVTKFAFYHTLMRVALMLRTYRLR